MYCVHIYIVSAFPDRVPPLLTQLGSRAKTVLDIPAGSAVREAPNYRITPSPVWRDTVNPKPVTWGEMSCLHGHMQAWQQIAQGTEPAIILEDDAEVIGLLPTTMPDESDLHYLGWKTYKHVRWWTIGYAVTPHGAELLLKAVETLGGIPADEVLLWLYAGTTENRLQLLPPAPDSWYLRTTDTETPVVRPRGAKSTTDTTDWAIPLHVLVCATDDQRAQPLLADLERYGFAYHQLGKGKPDWDTTKEGGRCKLEWVREALADISEDTAVMVLDGYDVRVQISPDTILQQWGALRWPGIVAGEKLYWPKRDMQADFDAIQRYVYEGEDTPAYPYPCSGTLICPRTLLLDGLTWALDTYPEEQDDQALVQRMVLHFPDVWRIDREGYLFRSMHGAVPMVNGQDPDTGCRPGILHYNGPDTSPAPHTNVLASCTLEVADGILAIPVLNAEQCADLATQLHTLSELYWQPLRGDQVPGDELRLSAAGLHDHYAHLIEEALRPVMNARWAPTIWSSISDLFAIRYRPGKQDRIRLHTDLSRFSASIALETAEKGGVLWFPRQNFRDDLVPVGTALVFPSRVTHPHAVTPVTAGRRTALVVWTKT